MNETITRTRDEENPDLILQQISEKILIDAAMGRIDLNLLARKELANRGLNKNGKWVGFEKAK